MAIFLARSKSPNRYLCVELSVLTVTDLEAYDCFCDRVLYGDDNLRKFRTLLSRKRHKFDLSVPMESLLAT
tara:strand:- start:740 stop:952 length:213 start_codon:yes stop_codon:yes gene_type:complete